MKCKQKVFLITIASDSSARLYQQDVSTKFQKMKKKKKLNFNDFQQKIGV